MELHFYAQRQYYKDGTPKTPDNYPYQTRRDAEKQYHLLCANAISNSENRDFVAVEFGTIENGWITREFFDFRTPVEDIEQGE